MNTTNLPKNIEQIFDFIEQKELKNLLDSVKDGKVLKPADRERIEELKTKFGEQKEPEQWHIRPLKDILWIFGITKQGFNMRMGMPDFPKAGKVGRNKYDLKVIYDWTIAHFYGSAEEEASLAETKLAREKKKLEKETMEVDALKKTLIPVAQIKSDLRMVGTGMKNRFLAWYKTLPPLLIGRDEKEMGLIIRQETRALLTDLSRGLESIIPKKKKKGRKCKKK